jgi:hypothetical protein
VKTKGYLMKPFSSFFSLFIVFCLLVYCRKDTSPIIFLPEQPDTTNHEFTWIFDTIGTNWSILLDVAIIDENDIWAVGEIHTVETDTFDSLGNWVPPYNAVHWNGQEWELKRINFYLYPNGTIPTPYTIQTVFAFSENDIWFTRGASFVHWDGNHFIHDCSMNSIIDGSIQKIWGISSEDLYAVGYNGTIIYYNGSGWQELESGTDVDIQDIWGALNPQTSEYEILSVASFSIGVPQAKQLLRIDGTTVSTLQDSVLPLALETVWFAEGKEYFIGGEGIYHTNDITRVWELDTRQPVFYVYSIRGIDTNDFIMVGGHGYISHYNGSTSKL